MSPIGMSEVNSEREKRLKTSNYTEEFVANEEIIEIVDKNIPLGIRLDYIRFKNGLKLPKPRRDAVRQAIFNILKENNLDG